MTLKSLFLASALAVTAVSTAAWAENPMVGGAPMYDTKTIVENAVNSKDHTTLVAAVKAAALWHQLDKWGLSFKKNAARQRARSARRTAGAPALASQAGQPAAAKAGVPG